MQSKWDCFKVITDEEFDKNMMVIGYKRGSKTNFTSDFYKKQDNKIELDKIKIIEKLS